MALASCEDDSILDSHGFTILRSGKSDLASGAETGRERLVAPLREEAERTAREGSSGSCDFLSAPQGLVTKFGYWA